MKKKNILFILLIIFGIPFLFLALLVGGAIWLFTSVFPPPPPPPLAPVLAVTSQPVPTRVEAVKSGYNIDTLNFVDFTDHLSLDKNTSMHVSYFWEKAKGHNVKWTGQVVDVKGGRSKAEISVLNNKKPSHNGINIILISYNPDQAAALKKGEDITFSGEVYNYKGRAGNPIIVYLKNVEILH